MLRIALGLTFAILCNLPFEASALDLRSAPVDGQVTASPQLRWTSADLSILVPLPKAPANDTLLRANSVGSFGPLIPSEIFARVPKLDMVTRTQEQEYATLRAVGFRIDPCYPGLYGGCRRQIRIVWQPIYWTPQMSSPTGSTENEPGTSDVGVHTFYDLTEQDFGTLLKEIWNLKVATGISTEGPLSVHPAIKAQGLSGEYLRQLQHIILSHIGQQKLSRLTFMLVRGDSVLWTFGGFNMENGKPVIMQIPRIPPISTGRGQQNLQVFMNRSFSRDNFDQSNLNPAPEGKDTFNLLMRDSSEIRPTEDHDEIFESLASIYRIENPDYHNPETMDCVSCHVAQAARNYTQERFGTLIFKDVISSFAFKSKMDLRNVSESNWFTNNLHAFSYFGDQVAISQRSINEAAAVADGLNERRAQPFAKKK